MPYVRQTVNGGEIIQSTWGNHIQSQYDEAKEDLDRWILQSSNGLGINPLYRNITTFSGNIITEEIRLRSDNSLFASKVTSFDVPTVGQITMVITCSALNINITRVTTFNGDGSITEE